MLLFVNKHGRISAQICGLQVFYRFRQVWGPRIGVSAGFGWLMRPGGKQLGYFAQLSTRLLSSQYQPMPTELMVAIATNA
jgi:hypothetical protein